MCGIVGIYAYRSEGPAVDREELARIQTHMHRRGPDGAGLWISEDRRIGLAHRRLAIIDLTDAGAQPMLDPITGNQIVFNGEIYNYRELRRQLEGGGARFRTHSDTEVLLHLYRDCGVAMVERLRGMFAFAIWDDARKELILARDPLGIKPLYFADDGRTLRFASQVKALAAGGGISEAPSTAGLAGFYIWGHVPEPWTWLTAVRALPAGSTLTVRRDAPMSAPVCYFDLRQEILTAEAGPAPTTDALDEALEALADSVRAHLVADVPVGVFLSAGRDSSLIAALAARNLSLPMHTITLGFQEYRGTSLDEVPAAEAVARALGSVQRTEFITRAHYEAEAEHIITAMDQPSIDGVNTYLVSQAASRVGLKVALSGLGGDEAFGGYPSFRQIPRLTRWARVFALAPWFGRGVRALTAPFLGACGRPKWAGLLEYGVSLPRAYLLRRALHMPWELPRLMGPDLARQGLRELALVEDLAARVAGIRSPAAAVLALEMSCYMRNQLLRDADWAGMAHGVEVRTPLVDVQLLRRWLPHAVRRLPFARQRLLEGIDTQIADIVGNRPKSGFSVPVAQWTQGTRQPIAASPGLRPRAADVAERFAPARDRECGRRDAPHPRGEGLGERGRTWP